MQQFKLFFEGESGSIQNVSMGEKSRRDGKEQLQKGTTIAQCVEAYIEHGTISGAARSLGVTKKTLQKKLAKEMRKRGVSDIREIRTADQVCSGNSVTKVSLLQLIESQDYRCGISGVELTPETAALDHITPVSKGGEHVIENVMWVHHEINRMKGVLPIDEFVALCRKVTQYTR
jgi:5-methylcytosine-specific restriction endonuclease McrA